MLVEAMGQIIYPQNVRSWGKQINTKEFRNRLFQQNLLKGPIIHGLIIYYIKYGNDEYELFAFNHNDLNDKIVYYCRIRSNTTRNTLFKPNVGFSTSAVWRDVELPQKGFALSVYEKFITTKLIDKCIISDLQQTQYGIDAFVRLAAITLRQGWSLYAAFSSPGDAPSLVKMTVAEFLEHEEDIFNYSSAYAFRCGVLLKNNVDLKSILNNPNKTLILSCKEAEDLDLFNEPVPLSDFEEILLEEEINRPKKRWL